MAQKYLKLVNKWALNVQTCISERLFARNLVMERQMANLLTCALKLDGTFRGKPVSWH